MDRSMDRAPSSVDRASAAAGAHVDAIDRARGVDAVLGADALEVMAAALELHVLVARADRPIVDRVADLPGEDDRHLLAEVLVRREHRAGRHPEEATVRGRRRGAA